MLSLSLVLFMAGSLLDMGLKLEARETWRAVRDRRFLALSLLWSFVAGPALAVLLARLLPLAEGYALGLVFLGLAPCAPFVPLVAQKAGGDLGYCAAYMALAAVGTVAVMPVAIPLLARGFSASPWTIARPLLLFIVLPLAVGAAVRQASAPLAGRLQPFVKKVTGLAVVLMLVSVVVIYGRDLLGTVGTLAIGTQFLYYALLVAGAYGLPLGLAHGQRSVIALGLGTRNVGAALAPLYAVPGTDPRAIVMCVLAALVTAIVGFGAARCLARLAPDARRPAGGLPREV